MAIRQRLRGVLPALLLAAQGAACDDAAPTGLARTPEGPGPKVKFDLAHRPLPEIPFPNDVATFADPTSRTGLRINASLVAPTPIERAARERFSELEGFGIYAPITVAFDRETATDDAALDLAAVRARHVGDDYDFADDAVYLVDLETGVPWPVDLGEGSFQYVQRDTSAYFRADPHAGQPSLLFDTRDEGVGPYEARFDTDFDGVRDRPNFLQPMGCQGLSGVALEQCRADNLLTFYERQTDTLILRPLVPLREKHEYAVVLTDRLRGPSGHAVKSPFDFRYHPSQERAVAKLAAHLGRTDRAAYYGDLAGSGLEHVAFAWSFTTQPVTEDLALLRDGLWGRGPFARLASEFPTTIQTDRLVGLVSQAEREEGATDKAGWESDDRCAGKTKSLKVLPFSVFQKTLGELTALGFGIPAPEVKQLVDSLDAISHVVVGTYETPYLLPDGPYGADPYASFQANWSTGEASFQRDTVRFYLFVPKATEQHKQPFATNVFGHGYGGSSIQAIAYAGNMARQGLATIAIDAAGHGFELGEAEHDILTNICRTACVAPLGDALFAGRARDLDGDGKINSGGDFLTAYVFRTRDNVRQSVLDRIQLVRVLRSFDAGKAGNEDYDGDGKIDAMGDFDGDGVVDLGGPDTTIGTWGQSLGGILSSVHGGIDSELAAAAPASPGGGLVDVIVRSNEREVVNASVLRTLGPLVAAVPATTLGKDETRCVEGEHALRFVVTTVNHQTEVEIGCLPDPGAGGKTLILENLDNKETRCFSITSGSSARVGIPAGAGERLSIGVWEGAHRVDSYASCTLLPDTPLFSIIDTWGKGLDKSKKCPTPDEGCSRYETSYFAYGDRLVFPTEGLGLGRGTPDLRRFFQLTETALEPADPISYAPLYAVRPPSDARLGGAAAARGLLTIGTVGDQVVPISTGAAIGRAAGAVPFLRPEAAEKYPEWAGYATPFALWESFGGRTANRALVDAHVLEGLPRLARHPAGPKCAPNAASVADAPECHPNCGKGEACYGGQSCDPSGTCVATVSKTKCTEALFDVDDLDDGLQPYDEQRAPVPLRLARRAEPVRPDAIDAAWAPRLLGIPRAKSDDGAWTADARVVSYVSAYIEMDGQHAFYNPAACQAWDNATYLANLAARFMATGGKDLYFLSHPHTHECLAKGTCTF